MIYTKISLDKYIKVLKEVNKISTLLTKYYS
jgi:hypothetical protein